MINLTQSQDLLQRERARCNLTVCIILPLVVHLHVRHVRVAHTTQCRVLLGMRRKKLPSRLVKSKTSSKQHGDVTDSLTAAVHHSKAQHASYQKSQTLVLLSFITLDTVNKRLIRRQHHCVLGKCRKHWSRYTFNLLSEQRLFTCMFRNMQHQHQPTCSTTLSLTRTWHMHSDPAYDYCRIRHAHQASSHASQYCWCPVVHIPGKLYCRNLLSGTSCPPA